MGQRSLTVLATVLPLMVIPATTPTLLSTASAPTRLLPPWDSATLLT